MARIQREQKPWEMYILFIILAVLGIIALSLVIGPTGSLKDAVDDIKPTGKGKLEKKNVFKELEKAIRSAKPKGISWRDLSEEDRKRMVTRAWGTMTERGFDKDIKRSDVASQCGEIWRLERTKSQDLPSDDAAERWKKLAGKKYGKQRRIDLKDDTGFLNCPQVDVFEDAQKTTSAGQMNHDEWVIVLAHEGGMTHVRRKRDKKIAWIETKFLREIYTKEDIAKGPKFKKGTKERTE